MTRPRCTLKQHVGPIVLRRRDARRAQQQCDRCLRPVGLTIPLAEFTYAESTSLPFWQVDPKKSRNSKAVRYQRFLRSPEWAQLRAIVLERCRGICEGENCGQPATTVHHKRYAKVLAETPLADLAGSCVRCNVNEREQRHAGAGRRSAERGG